MKVAAVDLSTETGSEWQRRIRRHRRRQWVWCSRHGGCGAGGGGGSVDRDCVRAAAADAVDLATDLVCGCGAVELVGVLKAAAVDLSTEIASEWRRRIHRHRRRQWV